MRLSEADAQLFYQLWLPLLDFVNEKYEVSKNLKDIAHSKHLDPTEVKKVANVLWDNLSLIDQYLEQVNLPDEHKDIILSLKRCIHGRFFMERHLKKGTIFISEEDQVYQVQGIITSWEEMFFFASLPLLMDATFIPFKDVIISDGIVFPYQFTFGKNITNRLKDTYMTAKKNKTIIRSL